jgi:4Fe-4S single cluster domain
VNCPSNHSLFLRSNGTLVYWDDRGQLKELQAFDPNLDYANQVYLGHIYDNIRDRLRKGVMPFPDYYSNCCCLMTHHPFDDGLVRQRTIETFQLEPSMGCQLDCPGCIKKAERSSWVPRTPFGHMTLKPEVVYKIVLDLKAAGIKVKKFDMQGSGEPLLNKKIWEMCGFLAEHYSDSVISICTHANAEFRPDMVMSGVNEILFAIDGVDQESYAPWRVHGNFDRAYRFMRDFSVEAAAKAPHIRRVWKYVLFSHNDTDAQLLRAQQLVSTQRSRSCALLSRNWPGFVPRIRRVGHTPPGPESEHRGRQLSYPSIAVDLQSPRSADSDS